MGMAGVHPPQQGPGVRLGSLGGLPQGLQSKCGRGPEAGAWGVAIQGRTVRPTGRESPTPDGVAPGAGEHSLVEASATAVLSPVSWRESWHPVLHLSRGVG